MLKTSRPRADYFRIGASFHRKSDGCGFLHHFRDLKPRSRSAVIAHAQVVKEIQRLADQIEQGAE
jgi:hypothetical protein